uniref:Uncharacterized protein n=1 Tax=Arundo donax TaxID=35708 RepID=A0A0A9F1L9_ARUDO
MILDTTFIFLLVIKHVQLSHGVKQWQLINNKVLLIPRTDQPLLTYW